MTNLEDISIIFPAYNESEALNEYFRKILEDICLIVNQPEFILIDDGSTDNTSSIAEQIFQKMQERYNFEYKLIRNEFNRGYGFSIKKAMRQVSNEIVVLMDPDGQHLVEDLHELLIAKNSENLVIGKRLRNQGSPRWRRPGKWLLNKTIQLLIGFKMEDPFSGFRVWNKSDFIRFSPLLSDGFSVGTSSALAAHFSGMNIEWIQISSRKRTGKSSVQISDGIRTFILILRIVILFVPLRVIGTLGLAIILAGIMYILYGLVTFDNTSIRGLIVILFGALVLLEGIVLEQISALRRQITTK